MTLPPPAPPATTAIMDRVLEWLKEQELLAGELHPEVQSIAAITSPFSSHGDPVGSPSDLIDLRSIKPSQSHRKSETNLGHCQIESISTLDLNQPAQHEQTTLLKLNTTRRQQRHQHYGGQLCSSRSTALHARLYGVLYRDDSGCKPPPVPPHSSTLSVAVAGSSLSAFFHIHFTSRMSANGSRPKAIQKRGLPELPVPRAPRQYRCTRQLHLHRVRGPDHRRKPKEVVGCKMATS